MTRRDRPDRHPSASKPAARPGWRPDPDPTPRRGVPARQRYGLHRIAVPGGTLAYAVWEPVEPADHPPAVVAIHGITGNHRCWPYLVDELPGYRVIAPDLRGRGGSAGIAGPFGMARHADDVAAVLDALGVESATVVGHSMGGFVAVVLAGRHPARVGSLVLVDGGLPVGGGSSTDAEADADRITSSLVRRLETSFPTWAAAVGFWRRHPAFERNWSPVVEDYARYDLDLRGPRLRSRVTVASVVADSRDALGPELPLALRQLDRPTPWLVAPRGLVDEVPGLYPAAAVRHWIETYPQLEVTPVADVNHYTIVMSPTGARAIAAALPGAHGGRYAEPRPP